MRQGKWMRSAAAAAIVLMTFGTAMAEAAGVLTIGRREDSTTFDPIFTAQNIDLWVFSNMYDTLVRVNREATGLEPGLAESWEISDDGLTYIFHLREAKFSDGSAITSEDAKFSLTRLRDDPGSFWAETFTIMNGIETPDAKTLVITLKERSAPFLSSIAMPLAAVLSEKGMAEMGPEAYGSDPVASGAFSVKEWIRGDRVILEKNPHFWQADRVQLDGVEWISVPDDNTRILKIQGGELDAAIFIPFARVADLKTDTNLKVQMEISSREDSLLINNSHGALAKKEVRQALDFAIDKQAIVDAVTFGIGEIANSYIPRGSLYHYDDNLQRPYDPAKAKQMLADAGASDLTLKYVVSTGDNVDEQIAVLLQQQLAEVGVTVDLQKVDPSSSWDILVDGDYDLAVSYWTNDMLDPDQKTTFTLGHDTNLNFLTRYENMAVKDLVANARLESDPVKREQMYVDIQKLAKEDAHWVDLYYSPFINVVRSNVEGFYQNPLGRFFLEDTVKN